jgi:hypothetical protein
MTLLLFPFIRSPSTSICRAYLSPQHLNKQNVFGRPKRFRVVRGDISAASLSVQPSSESG